MAQVSRNSVLVIIDVQKAWDSLPSARRNNPEAERVIAKILDSFRKHGLPVIHVRHDSEEPDSYFKEGKPSFDFKDEVRPIEGEPVITKHVNSALIGTDLEKRLRGMKGPDVYFVGLTTDHCVSTSARMAANLGFRTYVISDACAAYDRKGERGETIPADVVHKVNLASLDGEFAEVVTSNELRF